MQSASEVHDEADVSLLTSAWNSTLTVNRFGLYLRSLCIVTIGVLVLATPDAGGWRSGLLLPALIGVTLAGVEHTEIYLRYKDAPGLRGWMSRHFTGVRQHPAARLSGLAELAGMVCIAAAVGGPLAAHYASTLEIAVVALVVLVWNILFQTVMDVSWYNRLYAGPSLLLQVFRWAIAPLAGGIAVFVVLRLPAPGTLSVASCAVAAGSFLLLWPCMGFANTIHGRSRDAAVGALLNAYDKSDRATSALLHLIKGELKTRAAILPDESEHTETVRRATEDLLTYFTVEWALATTQAEDLSLIEIWNACLLASALDAARENGRLTLEDSTDGWAFKQSTAQFVRSAIMDLTQNAVAIDCVTCVKVKVSVEREDPRDVDCVVSLTVTDDGPGYFPTHYMPGTSMANLARQCRQREGALAHYPSDVAGRTGTAVSATFRAVLTPTSVAHIPHEPTAVSASSTTEESR